MRISVQASWRNLSHPWLPSCLHLELFFEIKVFSVFFLYAGVYIIRLAIYNYACIPRPIGPTLDVVPYNACRKRYLPVYYIFRSITTRVFCTRWQELVTGKSRFQPGSISFDQPSGGSRKWLLHIAPSGYAFSFRVSTSKPHSRPCLEYIDAWDCI